MLGVCSFSLMNVEKLHRVESAQHLFCSKTKFDESQRAEGVLGPTRDE